MHTDPRVCPYCNLKTEHNIHKTDCSMVKYGSPPFANDVNVTRVLEHCRRLILDEWPAGHPTVAETLADIEKLIGPGV